MGKHVGMIAGATGIGGTVYAYREASHPVQLRVKQAVDIWNPHEWTAQGPTMMSNT